MKSVGLNLAVDNFTETVLDITHCKVFENYTLNSLKQSDAYMRQ